MLSLLTPDDFAGLPYEFVTNQLSHALIGLCLTALVAGLLDLIASEHIDGRGRLALAMVSAGYLVGWEVAAQHLGAGVLDALADTFFVTMGGLLGLATWLRKPALMAFAMIATAGAAAAGVWRRK